MVLDACQSQLFAKLEEKLKKGRSDLIVQALYVLSSIASGDKKHKKLIMEDRSLNHCILLLKETLVSNIKVGVLILIRNLIF